MPRYRVPVRHPRPVLQNRFANPNRLITLAEVPILITYSIYMYHCSTHFAENWYFYLTLWKIFLWISQSIVIEHIIQESYEMLSTAVFGVLLISKVRMVSIVYDLLWNFKLAKNHPELHLCGVMVIFTYIIYNGRIFYLTFRTMMELVEQEEQAEHRAD